jgi:hypothetical protein
METKMRVTISDEPNFYGYYEVAVHGLGPARLTAAELRELCDDVPESAKVPDTVTVELRLELPRGDAERLAVSLRATADALDAEGER